jgi:hypothetical protein
VVVAGTAALPAIIREMTKPPVTREQSIAGAQGPR